jgi:hypothetical protein
VRFTISTFDHVEASAFAAAGDATVTGELAVCGACCDHRDLRRETTDRGLS